MPRRILPVLLSLVLAGCAAPVTFRSPLVLVAPTATATSAPTAVPTATATATPTPTPTPTDTPTPVPTPTAVAVACDDAIAAVESRHRTTLSLLAAYVGGVQASCGAQQRTGAFAAQPVALDWTYKGAGKEAVYVVAADGSITAGDTNARSIDLLVKYGPLAAKLIASL